MGMSFRQCDCGNRNSFLGAALSVTHCWYGPIVYLEMLLTGVFEQELASQRWRLYLYNLDCQHTMAVHDRCRFIFLVSTLQQVPYIEKVP